MPRPLPLLEFPVAPLDWDALFAQRRPVQVEVGSGKGKFLMRAAEADRASNWVGLERRWMTLALGVERTVQRGLDNVLFVRCDAMEVVRLMIPPASVSVFHVYYPDPWWKTRHRKRRVFTAAFVADVARGLEAGGRLRIATDVAEYYEEILRVVADSDLFEAADSAQEAWEPSGEPLTSYEAKYVQQGRRPLRAVFRRGALASPPPEPWISRKPRSAPLAGLLLRHASEQ